jgi:arylsulfatase A-like enzyme
MELAETGQAGNGNATSTPPQSNYPHSALDKLPPPPPFFFYQVGFIFLPVTSCSDRADCKPACPFCVSISSSQPKMKPVLIALITCAAAAAPNKLPHLLFAMIDDWGWYEAGFRGNPLAQTPFVDKMVANDALLIERHYGYIFCSPSRRSFLSGRLPPHVGQTNTPDATIDLRMKTIADKLAAAGYATGHSGKWHAGFFSMQQTPHGRGFGTSLSFLYGVDHWTQQSFEKVCKYGYGGNSTDLWDTDRPARGMNGTYGDYLYVGHAVETIMQHNTSTPLFYYLATEVAHMPNEAPRRFCDKFDPKTVPYEPVYAMSSIVDESLSNVTAALHAKGMWPNTLMVSDPCDFSLI